MNNIPVKPPFFGYKSFDIASEGLLNVLSHKVLFEGRWGFSKRNLSDEEYRDIIENKAKPALEAFIEKEKSDPVIQCKATYGYYQCRSEGNSIKLFNKYATLARYWFPRQKKEPKLCLADFINSDQDDVIACFAVTLGSRIIEEEKKLFAANKYYEYHLLHGLGAELADCAAVCVHRRIHHELYPELSVLENKLAGCRYSFGYPSCPELSNQKSLLTILDASKIGLSLTESFEMVPELSVSGFIIFNKYACHIVP